MKKIAILVFILILSSSQCVLAKKEKVVIPKDAGYVGILPNLEERFQSTQEIEAKPSFEYEEGFNDPNAIKPIPRNNPAFVNIIMKKDKTSKYLNDLNEIIPIIESLQTVIEDKSNVQIFNAKSYYLKENVEYFRDKYKNKSEESFISYKKLMELNAQVQTIAQLRLDSEVYTPYVTASGSGNLFSKNTIDVQLEYLLENIQKTLVVLKETR